MSSKLALAVLAGVVLVGAATAAVILRTPAMRTIEIGIEHSRFEPSTVTVAAGETVRFVVRNGDPIAHEFILGTEAEQREHERGRPREHHEPGAVSLDGGAEGVTEYTFAEAGTLVYGCHIAGHYDFGMRGTVEIRPS